MRICAKLGAIFGCDFFVFCCCSISGHISGDLHEHIGRVLVALFRESGALPPPIVMVLVEAVAAFKDTDVTHCVLPIASELLLACKSAEGR